MYEPGSTFKTLTASAALASGKWTVDTVFNDTGSFVVGDHTIQNWDGEGNGPVRLLEILKYSLNTGMAKLGITTGKEIMDKYLRAYGFGKATGIELPGEAEGQLRSWMICPSLIWRQFRLAKVLTLPRSKWYRP